MHAGTANSAGDFVKTETRLMYYTQNIILTLLTSYKLKLNAYGKDSTYSTT